MYVETLFKKDQFSLLFSEKERFIVAEIKNLISRHKKKCRYYNNILISLNYQKEKIKNIIDIPFIPVRLFKNFDLMSIQKENIFKILTSSGTTGQKVSKIFLDTETALLQKRALASIAAAYIGPHRLPMVIADSKNILKDRKKFSARGAGILGFSNLGRDHFYLLDEKMKIKLQDLIIYLERYKKEKVLFFGFTYMIWHYLLEKLKEKNIFFEINDGILIHSGGWKKLEEMSVNNKEFKKTIYKYLGINAVHNFYGMVEQVGGIYMECEQSFFHAPNFSEIIIRNYKNWEPVDFGEEGVVQTLSILPKSYPGNSILTEDIGTIIGIDSCMCGRKGTYFNISGRIPLAELRGCSDTHAQSLDATT